MGGQPDQTAPDHLEIERFSPFGDAPVLVIEAHEGASRYRSAQAMIVGTDREGRLPAIDDADFDILLTTALAAPRPWVSVPAGQFSERLNRFENAVRRTPHAASILRQVLRLNDGRRLAEALQIESFAYSALLGGGEFRAWRGANPHPTPRNLGRVDFERQDDHIVLTLNQPDTRNAMSAAMRDALCEALAACLDDPSEPRVTLRGAGECLSVGGDLAEFGANPDLAEAHTIRTLRSAAKLIDELGGRAEAIFHGACIGSGLEGPAAAAKRIAREGAFFQLPELKFGLIPGAGGTVTVARAIGRHRACAMMLGGARISAATALDWGLVHEVRARA